MTPDTPRRTRKDVTENRASLLAAAARTLSADPTASLDTIARAAGLNRRTLYSHFVDRDSMMRELIATGAARFNTVAEAAARTDEKAPIALARLTGGMWAQSFSLQITGAIAVDPRHVAFSMEALEPLRRSLLILVQRGQREGTVRVDVDAPSLARLIEETARTVLVRIDAPPADAASIAARAVLSVAGLSWREADELLRSHPGILGAADGLCAKA